MTFVRPSTAGWRVLSAVVASAALSLAAVSGAFASPIPQQTQGTLVGSVTCGSSDASAGAQVLVEVAGTTLSTRSAGDGKFTLDNVPSGQMLTVTALTDGLGSDTTSRPDVSVQAGETLDIGHLDLSICPAPAPPAATDQTPQDFENQP